MMVNFISSLNFHANETQINNTAQNNSASALNNRYMTNVLDCDTVSFTHNNEAVETSNQNTIAKNVINFANKIKNFFRFDLQRFAPQDEKTNIRAVKDIENDWKTNKNKIKEYKEEFKNEISLGKDADDNKIMNYAKFIALKDKEDEELTEEEKNFLNTNSDVKKFQELDEDEQELAELILSSLNDENNIRAD